VAAKADSAEANPISTPDPSIGAISARERALVIADDIGVFLAISRSLGRSGIEVDVATTEHTFPGLSSRYVKQVHFVPGYVIDVEAWVDAVVSLTRQHGYQLIFPTNDSSLTLLALHAERLGRGRLAIPNPQAFRAFSDKAETRKLAQRLGVPVAQGFEVDSSTRAGDLVGTLGLPFVLKPRQSYLPGGLEAKTFARIVESADEIEDSIACYGDRKLIAERFFPGEGVGLSVLARSGEIMLCWQHRRLAAIGATGRSSVRVGEAVDPVLLGYVRSAARATRLNGVAMFEFRHNTDSDSYILVEVNPRFWGSLPLAVACGADFPAHFWRMMVSDAYRVRQASPRLGVQMADLSGEWDRLSRLANGAMSRSRFHVLGRAFGLCSRAIISPARFDSWAIDDPRPYFADLKALAAKTHEALQRRLFAVH
jgi:predicted ATP-grasp superfamily ATP-dependent carboligase